MTPPRWWLSFADASLPAGSQFLGVVIVRGRNIMEAATVAHWIGINPGGGVQGIEIPETMLIADRWVERLLTRAECEAFDASGGQ